MNGGTAMKVQEIIREFIPCEVCGNRDINHFYLHVFVHRGSQPYVKCCECEEEFFSRRAEEIITKVKNARKTRLERIKMRMNKEGEEYYIGLSERENNKNIEESSAYLTH